MKKIWAPWRMDYILREDRDKCPFCEALNAKKDKENLILYRGKKSFVIMNRFPYTNGHLLIVPYDHVKDLSELDDETSLDMTKNIKLSSEILKRVMFCQGLNIGLNVGEVAGAGVLDHIHFHVVPRWQGDNNFMPVLSECRVISEHLIDTYDKLLVEFKKI